MIARPVLRCLLCFLALLVFVSGAHAAKPKLVLQITVDGLRADLLHRYRDNFSRDGFNHLLGKGAVFTNARYLHANTETIVGHTTLATGATPALHGMVGNVWYHTDTGELGYNIEDPDAPLLPTRDDTASGGQVDPAQLLARSSGRSPRGILVPTLADTLAISGAAEARIFAVSSKDRSAVAMAGKAGTAFWYSTDSGDFQTSRYYMDAYPEWVRAWNQERRAAALADTVWDLLLDPEDYLLAGQDDRPYEIDLKGFGRTFPHAYGLAEHPLFFTRVLVSPAGDRLLADFGKRLIVAEQVGQDALTDYLSVSFSGVDAVNHFFGPSSLESEDTVLRLDRVLADFLKFVDRHVGLDDTLIVLSADHGMAEMPEYASERGFPAGRFYSDELMEAARASAQAQFGSAALVKYFFRPYLYIDRTEAARLDLDAQAVIDGLAAALVREEGIAAAIPSARAQNLGDNAVANNHHPSRSGDIYIYQYPHWFLSERGPIGVMHGSPWAYDNHVPLIFLGPGVGQGVHYRLVHPIDVAPTVSALLGLPPPAAAQGNALVEVFSR